MKYKFKAGIFFLALLMMVSVCSAAFAMKRVAVLPFDNKSALSARGGVGLDEEMNATTDYVIEALLDTGRFDVIEREQITKVLDEQGLGMTGVVDASTATETGKILGVDYLVYGSITNVSSKESGTSVGVIVSVGASKQRVNVRLNCRLIDVRTGRILKAASGSGNSSTGNFDIGVGFRDRRGHLRGNEILTAGSIDVTSENVDNALYKAANDMIDTLMDKIDGNTPKRRR